MKKIIRLTESDLMRLVKRVIKEQHKYDDDFFYKEKPGKSYYYDKDDNVSDIGDDTDMDKEIKVSLQITIYNYKLSKN